MERYRKFWTSYGNLSVLYERQISVGTMYVYAGGLSRCLTSYAAMWVDAAVCYSITMQNINDFSLFVRKLYLKMVWCEYPHVKILSANKT